MAAVASRHFDHSQSTYYPRPSRPLSFPYPHGSHSTRSQHSPVAPSPASNAAISEPSPLTSTDSAGHLPPSKPPLAIVRPDSAAHINASTGSGSSRPFRKPPSPPHLSHSSRDYSPRTDPGPSTSPRRPSLQQSEPRSWHGDFVDVEKLSQASASRPAAYSPEAVVIHSTYSDSDLESVSTAESPPSPIKRTRDTTLKSLFKLSTVAPFVSCACLAYTLIALVVLVITAPLKLCLPKSPAFKNRTLRFLIPSLNLQRTFVYMPRCTWPQDATILPGGNTPSLHHPYSSETVITVSSTKPGICITVQLLSPFISVGLMFASWVVASFWALSAFIQDDAVEKKHGDDDGKAYAKKMIRWWCDWLDGSVLGGTRGGSRGSRSSGGSRRPEMQEQRRSS